MSAADRTVLFTIEREHLVGCHEVFRIRVEDGHDYVPLEPQARLEDAEAIERDMAEMMNRLGVGCKFARLGFTGAT